MKEVEELISEATRNVTEDRAATKVLLTNIGVLPVCIVCAHE